MRHPALLVVGLVLPIFAVGLHAQEPFSALQSAYEVPIPGAVTLAPGEAARFRYPDEGPPWMLPGDPRPLPRPGRGVDVINTSDSALLLAAESSDEGYVLTIEVPSGLQAIVRYPSAASTTVPNCTNVEAQPELTQCNISLTPPPVVWVIAIEPAAPCPRVPDS
jgi:hypothetical protein